MLDNTQLQVAGITRATLRHPKTGRSKLLEFTVAQRHTQPLISCEVSIQFDLIKVIEENICSLQVQDAMQPIITKYDALFHGYGELAGDVHLDVDKTAAPVRVPLRKLPVVIRDKVEAELHELVNNGIIASVTGPSAWISALLVTTKANCTASVFNQRRSAFSWAYQFRLFGQRVHVEFLTVKIVILMEFTTVTALKLATISAVQATIMSSSSAILTKNWVRLTG